MIDSIVGKDGKIYAIVEFYPDSHVAHCFRGKVIEYMFPDDLAELIQEYTELVDGMVLSVLDEIEEKIYGYGLKLRGMNVLVFNLELKNKTDIIFFDKYPTGNGFVDEFPTGAKPG
jgi:hypothetical protein